jgi:hypothetical protein
MSLFLVAYELAGAADQYSALRARLTAATTWFHHLDSLWLIDDPHATDELAAELTACINEGDKLIVIDVTGRATHWRGIDGEASDWLRLSP